jgi:5-hydroxyisourate hydrolase-like protein (transthyretin family)
MLRRCVFRLSVFVAAFGLIAIALTADAQDTSKRGRKYKSPPPSARIEVTVLRDVNGKPIENAAVVFHPMQGEKDKGNLELKTNEDGRAVIDVLPIGDTVRLQVIARGFQTYGQDYKIDKAEMSIEVKMKRPGEQYSIYKNHPEAADAGKSPDGDKAANPPKGAAPARDAAAAPAKDKPASPPAAQPSQPQPK